MAYSIVTKDGITIDNIPDNVDPESQELKDRVAAIRSERQVAQPVRAEDTRSGVEQMAAGASKRVSEMGQGLRGLGLRAGTAIGLIPEETLREYESQVEQERSVMSPRYGATQPETPLEYLGGMGVDLASMYAGGAGLRAAAPTLGGIPRLGGQAERAAQFTGGALAAPRTAPQAMLGGALYSQTYPFASTQEAAGAAGISAGIGGAVQPALRAMGLAPSLESRLEPAQREAARRAVESGFQFTPAQMTGSRTGAFIEEGIKALPLARGAYTKLEDANQKTLQDIAARSIGLKQGLSFTPEAMRDAYENAYAKYAALKTIPSIKLDKAFSQEVDRISNQLAKIPESQAGQLGVPDIRRVLDEYKTFVKNAVDGDTMFFGLRAIGDQLFEAQKQGRIGAGAYKDLRTAVENAVERSITQPAKKGIVTPDVVKKFKEGRAQLSNWFTVDEAFNPATGELSGAKLANSLARKSHFGTRNTEIETAALAVRAFPRALPSSGTAERAEAAGMVKQAAQALTIPAIGAGATGMYTQDPYAAAMAAAAAQTLPGIAARIATSEPVRSIVARRQLGAISPDEGILAGTARRFETGVPSSARLGLGDIVRLYAEREQLQGLLGE
jgi:hypothetical protein